MITNEIGRRLRILVIDDREQAVFIKNFSTHVIIEQIASWKQAQRILARDGKVNGADVLLIDVSMIEDHDIRNAVTKDASVPILPAGPLLALPFIGARAVMSCKVYSAHMQNSDLHKHPYFLLAMGLIAARTENAPSNGAFLSHHLCPEASSALLDTVIQQHAKIFYADTQSVFAPALEDYRERLDQMINLKLVSFCNRAEASAEIDRLRKALKSGKSVPVPDSLKLVIVGENWSDCISMRSLFADKLKSSAFANAEWLDEVNRWLELLGESTVDRALNVLQEQNEEEKRGKPRPLATAIRDKVYPKLSRQDKDEVLRCLVLFANAYALDDPNAAHEAVKAEVYGRLGLDRVNGQNTYMGWFGERKPRRRGLTQLSTKGNDKFERCFLSPKSFVLAKDHEGIERYRAFEEYPKWERAPYNVVGKAR